MVKRIKRPDEFCGRSFLDDLARVS